MKILQAGSGDPRPLVLVYHVNVANEAAIVAACPSNALVAVDTRTNHYVDVPSLADTEASLEAQVSATLSPVVLAGFSEGGLVTNMLLKRGADPDALVIADGTYGSDFAAWRVFAEKAKTGRKIMLASYSMGTATPRAGLMAATGFPLDKPGVTQVGNLTVYGYGDGDHSYQGRVVLPKMLSAAFANPVIASEKTNPLVYLVPIGIAAAFAWHFRKMWLHQKGRRRALA